MRNTFTLIIALLCITLGANAQSGHGIQWQQVTNTGLPSAVEYYESTSDLEGGQKLKAFYTKVDFSTGEVALKTTMTTSGFQKPSAFAKNYGGKVYTAINGGFYGANGSVSLVIDNSDILAHNIFALSRSGKTYYPTRSAIGINKEKKLAIDWVYGFTGDKTVYSYTQPAQNVEGEQPLPSPSQSTGSLWEQEMAMGGGPLLIKDGEAVADYGFELFPADIVGSRAPRTAVGITANNELISLVVDGRQSGYSDGVTLRELTDMLEDLGCVAALNLDGGGSSAMVVDDEVVNKPSDGSERSVKSVLMVVAAPKVMDTEGDAYQEKGTVPFEEASSQEGYGTSPSRIVTTDQEKVTAEAIYTLEGIVPGKYEVEAWWQSSEEYASDATFQVRKGEDDFTQEEVKVDQTDTEKSHQFNTLGVFDLSEKDSIVLVNQTTTGSKVNIDAIRLRYLEKSKPTLAFTSGWDPSETYAKNEELSLSFSSESPNTGVPLTSLKLTKKVGSQKEILWDYTVAEGEEVYQLQGEAAFTVTEEVGMKITLLLEAVDSTGEVHTDEALFYVTAQSPTILFDNNRTRMEGTHEVGEVLSIPLSFAPVKDSRPLKQLSIYFIAGEEERLLKEESIAEGVSAYTYTYEVTNEASEAILSFQIEDVNGYISKALYTMQVPTVLGVSIADFPQDLKITYTEEEWQVTSSRQPILGAALYTLEGRVLYEKPYEYGVKNVRIPLKTTGQIYLLKIITSEGTFTRKVM
ncbi:phosphodiester glycosidase family protein [Algivirga pacifica]|uniref:Phosphodiester glycosidase domain-containing protein n=1 Tax=Algivirga pacifica TaxID=1162670 RepID=A0ABP9D4T4_9BACT